MFSWNKFVFLSYVAVASTAHADWAVDFSRRADQMPKTTQMTVDTSPKEVKVEDKNIFDRVLNTSVPMQDIVILNTEQGFVPSTVRVKEGSQYRIVVVNVNEKSKNVSFVLDSFSEHHATFYGKLKSFYINPKKEGVYTFVSPETSAQGRLIVHPATGGTVNSNLEVRSPASE
jgi:hypothetical protein